MRFAARIGRSDRTVSAVLPPTEKRRPRNSRTAAIDELATPELLAEVARRYDAGASARQIVDQMPGVNLTIWRRAVPPERRSSSGRELPPAVRSEILRRKRAGASVASLMVEFSTTRHRIQVVLAGE